MMVRIGWCGVFLASALAIVGCKSVPQGEYEEALAENAELRDRLASAQSQLERSEADKQELISLNQEISSQVDRLESERASGPAPGGGGIPGASMRGSDVVVTVAGDVLFDSGQATLKAAGRRELDRIARSILQQYPGNTVRVEGYTDTDPIRRSKWKSNERLSAERALAVEEYLIARGVDRDQIYSAAMGPASPKSSKQASRRVEIVILDR